MFILQLEGSKQWTVCTPPLAAASAPAADAPPFAKVLALLKLIELKHRVDWVGLLEPVVALVMFLTVGLEVGVQVCGVATLLGAAYGYKTTASKSCWSCQWFGAGRRCRSRGEPEQRNTPAHAHPHTRTPMRACVCACVCVRGGYPQLLVLLLPFPPLFFNTSEVYYFYPTRTVAASQDSHSGFSFFFSS